MKVYKETETPLYIQLKDILIEKIQSTMSDDQQLDSEREICEMYKVSRTTVRQALAELEKQKYIYKVQGKGNFILNRKIEQQLVKFYSFTNEMHKINKVPESKVISFIVEASTEKIASKLGITTSDLIYKIVRIRIADKIPMIYETTYLPFSCFPNLDKEILEKTAMYEVLQTKYRIEITSAEEYLEPVLPNDIESFYLDISRNEPSLKIERTTYQIQKVIEYTVSIARGDQFKYRISLKKE